jgi:hypothetical protein
MAIIGIGVVVVTHAADARSFVCSFAADQSGCLTYYSAFVKRLNLARLIQYFVLAAVADSATVADRELRSGGFW